MWERCAREICERERKRYARERERKGCGRDVSERDEREREKEMCARRTLFPPPRFRRIRAPVVNTPPHTRPVQLTHQPHNATEAAMTTATQTKNTVNLALSICMPSVSNMYNSFTNDNPK